MPVKTTDGPKITDQVQIDFITLDENDTPINPYRVDSVVVYYIERDFTSDSFKSLTETVGSTTSTMYYTDAVPVYSFGNSETPAWDSTDTTNAFITKNDLDDDGNVLIGNFTAIWTPKLSREGDYFVCYTWTPLIASSKLSSYQSFFVYGDTPATTAIPSHQTPIGKYETLLERYLPEMYKLKLAEFDITPDVLSRFHQAVAKGFTTVEDLANQLIDLMDANVCHEAFLPYLANLFRLKLRSSDPTLWRRQIKKAIPTYKKKGTLDGLKDALSSAGIKFQKLTQYYQVVSKSTWQEGFVVEENDQTTFALTKVALLPIDVLNYELKIRYVNTTDYINLNTDYVTFTTTNGVTIMTWNPTGVPASPIPLVIGDVVVITYKISTVANQSVENYIRALPLADKRDETLVSNPKKNWNVKLIAQDDVMFTTIIPTLHPFAAPIVWGKVRTEFAYSENAYNMEEYNGSLRNSNIACDIDGSFVDSCSACLGSIISVDVEIEDLNNDRVAEATEIIKDCIPFHAQIDSVNFNGSVNEYVIPPVEEVEMLIQFSVTENVLIGQGDFTRIIPILNSTSGQILRNMLSTSSTAVSTTSGNAFNDEIVLYCPDYRFDTLGVDTIPNTQNLLQILSGINTGTYNVELPGQNTIKIIQGSPDSIPYPLNTAAFTFNLSNEIASILSADIFQDDYYLFSESGQDFRALNLPTGSKVVVSGGAYAGSYTIDKTFPDNTLSILAFPSTINVTGLKYSITNSSGSVTYLNRIVSGSGKISVTRRGRVETIDLIEEWDVKQGYYIRYSGTDYKIVSFKENTMPYIINYTGGTVAGVPIKVYKRLIDNGIGYVDARGMYLVTSINYEAALDVQNGSNPPTTQVENSSFMENFLVEIDGNYYQITDWNGTRIDLSGPKAVWGLAGTAKNYSIIQYDNTSPVDHIAPDGSSVRFQRIDRRGNEPVSTTTQSASMYQQGMALGAAALNRGNGGSQIIEEIKTEESISYTIEWDDGTIEEGQI
jgi:hypothetical protein